MTCANCGNDSLFEYRLTQETSIFYCERHLPKFLNDQKKAGVLNVTPAFKKAVEESVELLAPAAVEEAVEEVVEEESEESKPVKKATKKKAE